MAAWEAALDSSAGAALALRAPDGAVTVRHLPLALRSGERELAIWLQRELAAAGLSIQAVRRWTVGTGPGSFSGLRVGIALLQGVCAGSGAALRGVPGSLAMTLAAAARQPTAQAFTVLHDARQRQLIVSRHLHAATGWAAAAPPFVATPEQVAALAAQDGAPLVLIQDTLPPGLLAAELPAVRLPEFPVAAWFALPWAAPHAASTDCEPVYVRPPVFS